MTDFGPRPWNLVKTGQITTYEDYDDGYYQKGWDDGTRFITINDGTVTDRATGLMWPQDFTGDGGNNGNIIVWAAAILWAKDLIFAGYSDWRIPNLNELSSILNIENVITIDTDIFDNVTNIHHWTSSTYKNDTSKANYVHFHDGSSYPSTKLSSRKVIAVRTAGIRK